MGIQSRLNRDRTLAVAALGFTVVIFAIRELFGIRRWTQEIFTTWQILGWTATILVGCMVVLGVLRLVSSDRTIAGSLLAIVALLHAPLHAAMWFGLVEVDTMFRLARITRWGFYPLLAVLGIVVLVRPVFRGTQRSPATVQKQ